MEKGGTYNPSGISLFPRNSGKITKIGAAFWKDAQSLAFKKQIDTYLNQPSLVLHGGKDAVASEHEIREFFCTPKNLPEVRIIRQGDHGFIDIPRGLRDEVLQTIVLWFKKTLF